MQRRAFREKEGEKQRAYWLSGADPFPYPLVVFHVGDYDERMSTGL